MQKLTLIPCALLAFTHGAFAQQLPSAASQMQQIPPTPMPQKTAPTVTLTPAGAPATVADAPGVKIVVKRLGVAGAGAYSEAELLAVTGFAAGSELSLPDLRAMAAKIAAFYHRNGYFLAQAYLPQQNVKDGAVTIAVLEGRYGKVLLRNGSGVSDDVANGLLSGLDNGDIVAVEPLENRLLLLSDLPGVQVKSTLVPGASVGASDLIVDLTPGQRLSGSIDADNAGNRYTGANRIGATVNLNDPTGHGDVVTLRVLSSGSGLDYGRFAYQVQFGRARVGVAYSDLRYKLKREFAPLNAKGSAKIASVYGNYPLIRSRNTNLYAQVNFDAKRFEDRVGSTSSVTDKTARVLNTSLYGDRRDKLGGGGLNSYGLTWSTGEIDLQTPSVRAFDAMSAASNGRYNKLGLNVARLQSVTESLSVYAAANGQWASKNLDVSEKMELGGMYGVRAYPEGEAYADQGYVLNLEARMTLQFFSGPMAGQVQLVGFADHGSVRTNENAWTVGHNHRALSGAGVGLTWAKNNNVMVKAYYAHKLGNEKALSAPDSAGRFWVQAVKYF
ncbi:ShlB/FhaC/HecB family hemolysin secretion/activation protein [Massilia sp. CMS3.1]|uniref:ShlB/FhaC/HecB family hemolysin secretion/activation protein n=1 Tax=Massilia sp. CMS3.1 TaxID=3373083 RepID=UPI003EE78C66